MSVSIHINGKPIDKVRNSMMKHMARDGRSSKDEIHSVMEATDSYINPDATVHNMRLAGDFEAERDLRGYVKKELSKVNARRVAIGKRPIRSDANIVGYGTLQLSNETLELMGYTKRAPYEVNETSRIDGISANSRVIGAYLKMVDHIKGNPGVYGKLLHASIHFDESTPHVDFIVIGIDENNPERTMRDILNGRKGYKRGRRLKEMQDHIVKCFDEREAERFQLHRGMSRKERKDMALRLREMTAESLALDKALSEREAAKKLLDDELGALEVKKRRVVDEVAELTQTAHRGRLELAQLNEEADRVKTLMDAQNAENRRLRDENEYLQEISDSLVTGLTEEKTALMLAFAKQTNFNGSTMYDYLKGKADKVRTADDLRRERLERAAQRRAAERQSGYDGPGYSL